MKFSESWLREWVNPNLAREILGEKLTMAGLEVEEIAPVALPFSNVVVGCITHIEKHPDADRLNVCQVDVGTGTPLTIVCGASNVRVDLKIPAALDGAELPNNISIKHTKMRGVLSQGMLCSAKEMGLSDDATGLFELPADAPVGQLVREYLELDDYTFDLSITPNRGDCLSIKGVAEEVSALTLASIAIPEILQIEAGIHDVCDIHVGDTQGCPRYMGRIIRGLNNSIPSPVWLRERLRRSGIRSISPVVDCVNYVMLELGQPMHAFDLQKLKGTIHVRKAKAAEKIALLDGKEIVLDNDILVIADDNAPLAVAGVMGGIESSVTPQTTDIFLESALFSAQAIALACRRYQLSSDSAYRFERGIDSTLQRVALDRVTGLMLNLVGGHAGPAIEKSDENFLPPITTISLAKEQILRVLGYVIADNVVASVFERLGFSYEEKSDHWLVRISPNRTDITLPIDLVEEIARLVGYDEIPCLTPVAPLQLAPQPETQLTLSALRKALTQSGYHEVVTYSFVDAKLQTLLFPDQKAQPLVNPITSDMSVMRVSIWPGLINTLLYNQNRQQPDVKIMESGLRFCFEERSLIQQSVLSGLWTGLAAPKQWGVSSRQADFFDMKGDVEKLLALTHAQHEFEIRPATHSALHPGQTAKIYRNDQEVGIIGAIHPAILQALKIDQSVFVFELIAEKIIDARLPQAIALSKFPEIHRDLALLVNDSIPVQLIQDTIISEAGDLLKQVDIFDVYQGKGIAPDQKSIALALTLQHSSRTLVDEEVASLIERIIHALKGKFNAELRG